MDMVGSILKDKGDALAGALAEKTSLTPEQATGFLPEALRDLVGGIGGGDLSSLLGQGDLSGLIEGLDIEGLASRVGIGKSEALQGLQSIAPLVLAALGEQGGAEGGLGKLRGLAGKLFGG